MKKLTKEQAVVLSAFTGRLFCDLDDYKDFASRAVGHPVSTLELADPDVQKIIQLHATNDMMAMCPVTGGKDPE